MSDSNETKLGFYMIRIADRLDEEWADWFDGMTLSYPNTDSTETILAGYVRDQAELYGLLLKLHNLNLTLVSVEAVKHSPDNGHIRTL
jgi:hypothetical protein